MRTANFTARRSGGRAVGGNLGSFSFRAVLKGTVGSFNVLPLPFEEYLQSGNASDLKSEFYQGEILAMSGGTGDQSLIGTNVTRELGNALMGKDCLVYGSDLKIRIDAADAGGYPDGMVICGPREYYNGEYYKDLKDVVTSPTVVSGGRFAHL